MRRRIRIPKGDPPRKPDWAGEPEPNSRGSVEDWEDAVFNAAGYFTVFRRMGRGETTTVEYATFCEAAVEAWHDPSALVYAVTPKGRSVCLIRSRWQHYFNMLLSSLKIEP